MVVKGRLKKSHFCALLMYQLIHGRLRRDWLERHNQRLLYRGVAGQWKPTSIGAGINTPSTFNALSMASCSMPATVPAARALRLSEWISAFMSLSRLNFRKFGMIVAS